MPTDFAFRLATYLSLGLACLCIGYAEWDLLPEGAVLAAGVIALLVVSFRTEGWFELSLGGANRVGLVIGLAAAGWLTYQFVNATSLINTLPWPASLLPYLGPLLMVLMPAKLFRPKHVGDWWAMQGIGLSAVGLASALADDEVFGLLLAAYAVTGVWSLTLFFYRREAGMLPPAPRAADPDPVPAVVTSIVPLRRRPSRLLFGRAVGWLATAAAVAFPVFLLTPRSNTPRWSFAGTRLETGLGGEGMVDLNRTGDLHVNRQVAFEVRAAYPDGRPMTEISPTQRWRAVAYNTYDGGRWTRGSPGVRPARAARPAWPPPEAPPAGYVPPDLGPRQFILDFTAKVRGTDPVLFDPVAWQPGAPSPVWSVVHGEARGWWHADDTSFLAPVGAGSGRPGRYQQAAVMPDDANLGPGFELAGVAVADVAEAGGDVRTDPFSSYRQLRLRRLREWAAALLRSLVASGKLPPDVLARAQARGDLQVQPQDFEAVGVAFTQHLKYGNRYQYTLKLRRQDRTADPVEDFLMNTKEGHCERFAAGLALALRAVGVPAAYVLGFRGCDGAGDGASGTYYLRQEFAHAWVEILVVRPAPPGYVPAEPPVGPGPVLLWHWRTLDPTPDGTDEPDPSITDWFGATRQAGAAPFADFVVGYNPERREEVVSASAAWALRYWPVAAAAAGVLAVAAGGLLGWRWWQTTAPAAAARAGSGIEWFDRLLRVLTAAGAPAPAGATPREWAAAAAAWLAGKPHTAGLADVPGRLAELFYQARYAGCPPTPADADRASAAVSRLEAALAAGPATP